MDIADPQGRERVGHAIRRRRHTLRLGQEDITKRGGPSKAVLYQLEHAKPKGYRDGTIARLEEILRWRAGSIEAIAQGGQPVELGDDASSAAGNGAQPIEIGAHGYLIRMYPNPEKSPDEVHAAIHRVLSAILGVDPTPDQQ